MVIDIHSNENLPINVVFARLFKDYPYSCGICICWRMEGDEMQQRIKLNFLHCSKVGSFDLEGIVRKTSGEVVNRARDSEEEAA